MTGTNYHPLAGIACVLLGTLLLAGCSGSDDSLPELAQAKGVVMIDGTPLGNVSVAFRPELTGGTSRGTTDDLGQFSLMYDQNVPGVVPGKHIVHFSILDADADTEIIPKKYRSDGVGFTAEVTKEGPNDFTFDLTDK